jgi:hypothetical protein
MRYLNYCISVNINIVILSQVLDFAVIDKSMVEFSAKMGETFLHKKLFIQNNLALNKTPRHLKIVIAGFITIFSSHPVSYQILCQLINQSPFRLYN